MFEVSDADAQKFSATNRLVTLAAIDRGWRVFAYDLPASHMYIDRGDNKKIHIYSSCPPSVSYADAVGTNDKWHTYQILRECNVTQLETYVANQTESKDQKTNFLDLMQKVVVKPRDGSHGNGITVGVENLEQIDTAIDYAMRHNNNAKTVIIQKQFMGGNTDLRLLCIAGKFIAAIHRVPARVHGDGLHATSQLIDLENAKKERGIPYRAKFASIDKKQAITYLGDSIEDIPNDGEVVTVLGVANYGAGGETIDVTDEIPYWLQQEAEKASRALGLSVSGVDYIATDKKDISELQANGTDAVLIEVNKAPALCIHDEPTEGINRHTTDAYLDFIAQY